MQKRAKKRIPGGTQLLSKRSEMLKIAIKHKRKTDKYEVEFLKNSKNVEFLVDLSTSKSVAIIKLPSST